MNSGPRTDRPNLRHGLFDVAAVRIGAMLLLFASAAAFEAKNLTSLSALSNDNIWWHLRTGIWILQNHGVPHSGLFSQSAELPWSAASWAYDLLLALAFRMLDLRSIPILLMVFKLAFAVMTFLLAGGLRGGRFWPAIVLSVTAQYMLGGARPGPCYFSILFFAFELLLLNESRRTGSVRLLCWLPLLFVGWANLDVQFVYGILLLALFLITSLLQDFGHRMGVTGQQRWAPIVPANAGIAATGCVIATLLTPYTYHLYGIFFATVTSGANRYLPDFHALSFRQPQDYVLMLLAMGAFLALGLRRSRDLFQIVLMIGCTMLAFHAQRDAWLVALAALAVIGEAIRDASDISYADQGRAWQGQLLIAGGLSVVAVMLTAALGIPGSHEALLAKAAQTYPVGACNYIREHRLPQPLFNAYQWGGFLTWYLPEYPVAIDSRPGLYDDDLVIQYSKAMNADVPYTAYPAMAQASTLLLQKNSLMGEALSTLPAFRVAYSDGVAVVLIRP